MSQPEKTSLMATLAIPLGVLGAVLGAFLGGYLFNYAIARGFYMPLLVGGCVGFATSGFARRGGLILALIAALVAMAGTLIAPWMATDTLNRPEFQEFVKKQFHLETMFVLLQLASPVVAFLLVMFTPPRPPKKSSP